MKRFLALFLTFVMLFTMSTSLTFAGTQKASATTMRIAAVDGSDVTVTNDKGKDSSAKADQKLLSGYMVKTGTASYCYISLDDSKAIKLDQNTKVAVEKSGKKIELNIKSGQIFFDVTEKLSGNESMNIKTSNITTGVRGTSGNVKVTNLGKTKNDEKQMTEINLLEGELEVRTASGSFVLDEGQKLTATGEQPNGIVSVTKADSGETEIIKLQMNDLEAFTIRATLEAANIEEGMEPEVAMEQPSEKLLENIIAGANGEIIENAEEINLPPMLQSAVAENPSAVRTEVSQADAEIAQEEKAAAAEESKAETALQAELASNEAAMTKAEKEQVEDVDQVFEAEAETTGGGGGGSNIPPQQTLLTAYTGVYDGADHYAVNIPQSTFDNYAVYLNHAGDVATWESTFDSMYRAEYQRMMSYSEDERASVISANGKDNIYEYMISYMDSQVCSEGASTNITVHISDQSSVNQIKSVDDSITYGNHYYYLLPLNSAGTAQGGHLTASITPYTLSFKWVKSGGVASQNETFELSDLTDGNWPVTAVVDTTGLGAELMTAISQNNSWGHLLGVTSAYTTAPDPYSANTEYTVTLRTTTEELAADDFAMPSTAPKYTFRTGDATTPTAPTATYMADFGTTWIKTVDGGASTSLEDNRELEADITNNGGLYSKITISSNVPAEERSQSDYISLTIPRTGSLSEVVFDGSSGITFTGISFGDGSNELTLTNKCQNLTNDGNFTLPGGVTFSNEVDATLNVGTLALERGAKFIGKGHSTLNSSGQIILNQDSNFETNDATVTYSGNDSYAINVVSGASYIQNGGELKIENTSACAFAKNGTVTFSNSPTVWKLGVPSVAAGAPTEENCVEYVFGPDSYSESEGTGRIWNIASVSNFSADAYTVLDLGTL